MMTTRRERKKKKKSLTKKHFRYTILPPQNSSSGGEGKINKNLKKIIPETKSISITPTNFYFFSLLKRKSIFVSPSFMAF